MALGFAYNPSGQITSQSRSNDAYSWQPPPGYATLDHDYTANGLNQYTAVGINAPSYTDGRGNLTSDGVRAWAYNSENMLVSASGGVTLGYDPMMRLYQTVEGGATTRMAYDGQSLIAEYSASNVLQHRYVHAPGLDEPLVWYQGADTSDRHWLHADERGSIIAASDATGVATTINAYDDYGIPAASNTGRFQYTGQQWLPELRMFHYRARIYSPTWGRFLQPDPILYTGGMNLYAYVKSDPVNLVDPFGWRAMNGFEIGIARSMFGNLIDYDRVNLEFGPPQGRTLYGSIINTILLQGRPVSDGDTIYFPEGAYLRDEYYFDLLHELMHVFQTQVLGLTTADLILNQLRHGFNQNVLYAYPPDLDFDSAHPEQQGEVVEGCAQGNSVSGNILTGSSLGIRPPVDNPFEIAYQWQYMFMMYGRTPQGTATVSQEPGTN